MPAALLLLFLLCGCAVRGEDGRFRLYEETHEDGTKSSVQFGKGGLVWKSTF